MKIRFRSIFSKIFLWFTVTFVLSLIGYVITSMLVSAHLADRDPPMMRVHSIFAEDARRAYDEGGASQLAEYLAQLDSQSEGQHFLVDARGRDLVTGEDRSSLLAQRTVRPRPRGRFFAFPGLLRIMWLPPAREGPLVLVHGTRDRAYRLIVVLPNRPRFGMFDSLVYFLWLPLLIGAFCYLLAVHLASPLRGLRRAVEKFGQGDLSVRYHLARRDEIGELAKAFNRMADQIATLLSAERRLLQDVSHELRSPLARLGFAVELAKTSPDRETALGRIHKEADRLNHLVDELLQLTRAEGDPGARNLADVDVSKLLQELVADCVLEADAAGCRLRLAGERAVVVTGDRELLRRACENILRNAIRHAPAGSEVEVQLAQHGDWAEVSVRDHGTGVPREALSEIFKPFYRVEGDRDRSSGGIGLGLAIARRAVELHQGRVTAFNANPGLVVAIELPCLGDGASD
jgi:signal transduction histidine kinase